MKINQVEELTGITKKNIRFYESEGLLSPGRDPSNGYREYSLEDIELLKRIRLLRKLDVPCREIRQMQEGTLSFKECMEENLLRLAHRRLDLDRTREICEKLQKEHEDFAHLNAGKYLEEVEEMEKGDVKFVNVDATDVKKRRTGAIAAAAGSIVFFALLLALIYFLDQEDPAPAGVKIFITVIIIAVIIGILLALRQRLGEVKKGEIDEASKY